jgi:hypothetical protein
MWVTFAIVQTDGEIQLVWKLDPTHFFALCYDSHYLLPSHEALPLVPYCTLNQQRFARAKEDKEHIWMWKGDLPRLFAIGAIRKCTLWPPSITLRQLGPWLSFASYQWIQRRLQHTTIPHMVIKDEESNIRVVAKIGAHYYILKATKQRLFHIDPIPMGTLKIKRIFSHHHCFLSRPLSKYMAFEIMKSCTPEEQVKFLPLLQPFLLKSIYESLCNDLKSVIAETRWSESSQELGQESLQNNIHQESLQNNIHQEDALRQKEDNAVHVLLDLHKK